MEFESVNKRLEQSIKENWERDALSNYQGVTLKYSDVAERIELLHIAFEAFEQAMYRSSAVPCSNHELPRIQVRKDYK